MNNNKCSDCGRELVRLYIRNSNAYKHQYIATVTCIEGHINSCVDETLTGAMKTLIKQIENTKKED